MHDFFKNLAQENDWEFEYARQDYLNLYRDIEADKVYLMMEPITSDSTFSDTGNETVVYSGRLFFLLSSYIDEQYQDKYELYIKPLFEGAKKVFIDAFSCSSFDLKALKTTEVINLFDQNLDGLLINYSVKYVE